MANKAIKNSTVFYHDWLKMFNKMTDEDVGKICKALLLLDSQGIRTSFEDSLLLDVIFEQLSATVERNRHKYEETCNNRSEAAKRREAQKAQTTTNDHNCADNDTDTDNENVNDTVAAAGSQTKKPKSKNKFKNFDERQYSDEFYEELERKMMGG